MPLSSLPSEVVRQILGYHLQIRILEAHRRLMSLTMALSVPRELREMVRDMLHHRPTMMRVSILRGRLRNMRYTGPALARFNPLDDLEFLLRYRYRITGMIDNPYARRRYRQAVRRR